MLLCAAAAAGAAALGRLGVQEVLRWFPGSGKGANEQRAARLRLLVGAIAGRPCAAGFCACGAAPSQR